MMKYVTAYLICGDGGSSYEGRDGGLYHAVGGDAVRRGVEPERGENRETKVEKHQEKARGELGTDPAEVVYQCCSRRGRLIYYLDADKRTGQNEKKGQNQRAEYLYLACPHFVLITPALEQL